MSSCFPSRMIGGSITQEIRASPEIVWETVTDREAATQILRNLVSQEIVKESELLAAGTVVHEVRLMNGKERESFKTITAISTNPYSISANIHLTRKSALSGTSDAARTGGWTIVPGENEKSSVFIWTFSAIPDGVCGSLSTLVCGKCLIRNTIRHFKQDLQDYAAEAERRQQLKDSNSSKANS